MPPTDAALEIARALPSSFMMIVVLISLTPGTRAGEETFAGQRALKHVEALVDFGNRSPFDPGIKNARTYIVRQLGQLGLKISPDKFTAKTPIGPATMMNILGRLPGKSQEIIILASHYDAKRFDFEFEGANDSGSSTGVLLELARALKDRPRFFTLWFVFFDGEEAVRENMTEADGLYGSKHLVSLLLRNGTLKNVRAVVLLDMIGDRDLKIKKDMNSTGWLTNVIWNTAGRLGHGKHFSIIGQSVKDDHTPFIDAGVDAVDVIDFDYGSRGPGGKYWHTADDTLDKISAESMTIVGNVILESIPEIEKELRKKQK